MLRHGIEGDYSIYGQNDVKMMCSGWYGMEWNCRSIALRKVTIPYLAAAAQCLTDQTRALTISVDEALLTGT